MSGVDAGGEAPARCGSRPGPSWSLPTETRWRHQLLLIGLARYRLPYVLGHLLRPSSTRSPNLLCGVRVLAAGYGLIMQVTAVPEPHVLTDDQGDDGRGSENRPYKVQHNIRSRSPSPCDQLRRYLWVSSLVFAGGSGSASQYFLEVLGATDRAAGTPPRDRV